MDQIRRACNDISRAVEQAVLGNNDGDVTL